MDIFYNAERQNCVYSVVLTTFVLSFFHGVDGEKAEELKGTVLVIVLK